MRFACALVLVACGSSRPQTATLPPQPSSSAPAPKPVVVATHSPKHELKRVDRKYFVDPLPSSTAPFDVEVRGQHDAALLSSIESVTHGWKYAHVAVSPRGDRFAIVGMSTQGNTAFALFDGAGKKLAVHAGYGFFGQDGDLLYILGNRLYASDGNRAIGGPQKALCLGDTCDNETFPLSATAGATKILLRRAGSGVEQSLELVVLDPTTATTTPLATPSKTRAFVGDALLATGAFCTCETDDSDGDGDRTTLECAAPPWTELKSIFVHDDIIVYLGAAGARVVAGMVDRLDVMDADGSNHVTYAPPLKGRPTALGDGRTVAIEGDDAIALVDIVDETYALVTGMAKTTVSPLAGRAKAFMAIGPGTTSLVRYE